MADPGPDSAEFQHGRGGALEGFPKGPPLLDRDSMTIEGLAFLGLNLSRNHTGEAAAAAGCAAGMSHPDSLTRQTQFDFNRIQDRDYKHFVATNDDGPPSRAR